MGSTIASKLAIERSIMAHLGREIYLRRLEHVRFRLRATDCTHGQIQRYKRIARAAELLLIEERLGTAKE